jgi:hypothetical protein
MGDIAEGGVRMALCWSCIGDNYLKLKVRQSGVPLLCRCCGNRRRRAITIRELGRLIESILQEHFQPGPMNKHYGPGDNDEEWIQEGASLPEIMQELLGEYYEFEEEIIDAVIQAENARHGEESWDRTTNYVSTKFHSWEYLEEWNVAHREIKQTRRFFSSAARELFAKVFAGLEQMHVYVDGSLEPVVFDMPVNTPLYRARISESQSDLNAIYSEPYRYVGPPPKEKARASRMNAEGIVVFYGATEAKTCLAELRPAIGTHTVVITVQTTQPLRILDFSRLERARGAEVSYFQPDFTSAMEKHVFMRKLHSLISQPVVPGREYEYLITQTMAEYLAYVHDKPLDGIMFASVQRKGGMNVVLFPRMQPEELELVETFNLSYVPRSLRLYSTESVEFEHHELEVGIGQDGEPWVYSADHWDYDDE